MADGLSALTTEELVRQAKEVGVLVKEDAWALSEGGDAVNNAAWLLPELARRLEKQMRRAAEQSINFSGTAKEGRLWGSSGGEIEFVRLVDLGGDGVEVHLTDHDHWPGVDEVADGAHYVLRMRKSTRIEWTPT